MRNDWRQFYVYDLEIGAQKNGASIPTIDTALAVWTKLKNADRTFPIRGGDALMLIGDIHVNTTTNMVTLLLRMSDKKAPHAVTSDPASGHFVEHKRVGNQGADLGCHVFISLLPETGSPNVYTCIIERIPGLPAALVQRLLSKFLHYEYDSNPHFYEYPHPNGGNDQNGNPRVERCLPHIELRGRPSDTMISDINNGHISGISLVKAEPSAPIGGAAYLTKRETELKLSIDQSNTPSNLWGSLKTIFRGQAQNYPTAKLAYKMPNARRSVTVKIDSSTGSPLDAVYVKSFEKSAIFPLLADSAPNIVNHLRILVEPELIAQRDV